MFGELANLYQWSHGICLTYVYCSGCTVAIVAMARLLLALYRHSYFLFNQFDIENNVARL